MKEAEKYTGKKKAEEPVDFLSRFTSSSNFQSVFQEGMSLVEETANYLDGPGRMDARSLNRLGIVAYATESMRLTTRLMQLASWLLLQKAINQGELTDHAAQLEKNKINLPELGMVKDGHDSEHLPDLLKALIKRSMKLYERISKLDNLLAERKNPSTKPNNPVADQVNLLEQTFKAAPQRQARKPTAGNKS